MYGSRIPSRILNDSRFMLGLTLSDLGAGVGIFVIFARIFGDTSIAPLSFALTILFWALLIPIRLKHRESTVRDWLMHKISGKKF